jgi:ribosomal protein L11 methyltransferase
MHKAIHFSLNPPENEFIEILIALLDTANFESIYEEGKNITAYLSAELFKPDTLIEVKASMQRIGCRLNWKLEDIGEKNWNRLWESNFEPVLVAGQCLIRAPFHKQMTNIPYQIIIEPKMSFGTGHHQTTRLMIELMLEIDFTNLKVLDMGCGTGVLGILAGMKNASEIMAVDIDRWACENTLENAARNSVERITVLQGGIEVIPACCFDSLLANINRNILLEQMGGYSALVRSGGFLLLSGILVTDTNSVLSCAEANNFRLIKTLELENWMAMKFERN